MFKYNYCFFIGQSLASRSANQYVDTVINNALRNTIRSLRLDPTALPGYTFNYKDKAFFFSINGKAEYSKGTLSGLSRVQRYSECDGPRNITGSTVVNCTLTFNNLQTSHKGKVKYGKLPQVSIDARGDVRYTIINVGFAKSFNERNARVRTFSFRNVGTIQPTFSGLGPLNNQTKILQDNYRVRMGSEVTKVINNNFQYALNMAASSVPMPVR